MFNSIQREKLEWAVVNSYSIAEVAKKLGISCKGSSCYRNFKSAIKRYNMSIDHFDRYKCRKQPLSRKRPLSSYLNNEFFIPSSDLRIRLLKEGVLKPICSRCNRKSWLGSQIPLQLDHIDGVHENNQLGNLRLLCPNCHALTDTFCGRKTRIRSNKCIDCNDNCIPGSIRCRKCANLDKLNKKTKIVWPSNEELLIMLKKSNYSQTAILLGVSDNAIRKRLKRRNLLFRLNALAN